MTKVEIELDELTAMQIAIRGYGSRVTTLEADIARERGFNEAANKIVTEQAQKLAELKTALATAQARIAEMEEHRKTFATGELAKMEEPYNSGDVRYVAENIRAEPTNLWRVKALVGGKAEAVATFSTMLDGVSRSRAIEYAEILNGESRLHRENAELRKDRDRLVLAISIHGACYCENETERKRRDAELHAHVINQRSNPCPS